MSTTPDNKEAVAVAVAASGFPIVTKGAVVYPVPALRMFHVFNKFHVVFGAAAVGGAIGALGGLGAQGALLAGGAKFISENLFIIFCKF